MHQGHTHSAWTALPHGALLPFEWARPTLCTVWGQGSYEAKGFHDAYVGSGNLATEASSAQEASYKDGTATTSAAIEGSAEYAPQPHTWPHSVHHPRRAPGPHTARARTVHFCAAHC